ncbi:uncharacterized protein C8Q71DRAFT_855225 [Rhodofomes roseus]|uniref:Uncharacterized protein n=1 Tax=Rhodofomes roseus TaxID=34475 RepID=A0ABQ8KP44_9APHY|nr:uncharacterized protein C8Q71DRAFT_855225 [Rhodofomes roseus]KAH9839920.1 hypothetical protein C8Q71DRAFT_855225 [Rhodofomes roseus]
MPAASGNTRTLRSGSKVTAEVDSQPDNVDVPAEAEACPSELDDDQSSPSAIGSQSIAPRRYATRPTNNLHPARTVGLGKRSQDDIKRDAKRKRDEKEAEMERKEASLEQQQLEVEQKLRKLAALEQELSARRELETTGVTFGADVIMSDTSVKRGTATDEYGSDGGNGNLTAKGNNQGRSDLPVPADEDDEFAFEAYQLEHSSDDNLSEVPGPPSGQKRKAKQPPAQQPKPKARKKQTQKDKRQEFLQQFENTKNVQRVALDGASDQTSQVPASARKEQVNRPTSLAKKSQSVKSATTAGTPKSTTTSRQKSAPRAKAPAPSLDLPTMGLKADWKAVVARQTLSAGLSGKQLLSPAAGLSTPSVRSSTTPAPKLGNAAHRAASAKRSRRQDSLENVGGFTDHDVTVGIGSLQERPSGAQLVRVLVGGLETREDDDQSGASTAKKKRRAKTTVSDEKSLSVEALPSFAKHHWKSTFVPTMLQMIGQTETPWAYASGNVKTPAEDNELIDVVQHLVDAFWPEEQYDVNGSDKVYRVARQAVIDWRSRFMSRIKSYIKKLLEKHGSREQISTFVSSALVRSSGTAFWATYDTEKDRAVGALQSQYVLKSFATHLAAVQGSKLRGQDAAKPARGALSLAATAVQYIFTSWTTGIFVAEGTFSGENCRTITAYWHNKSVKKIIEHGRYETCVRLSIPYMEAGWVPRAVEADEDDVSVCDPSSPPRYDADDTTTYD